MEQLDTDNSVMEPEHHATAGSLRWSRGLGVRRLPPEARPRRLSGGELDFDIKNISRVREIYNLELM